MASGIHGRLIAVVCLCATLAVGGCQSALLPAAAVDADEANLVRELFSSSCVLKTVKDASETSRDMQYAEMSVMSITARDGGWRAADIAYRGFRGNFYFNRATAQVLCGDKNWRAFQAGRYVPNVHPLLRVSPPR